LGLEALSESHGANGGLDRRAYRIDHRHPKDRPQSCPMGRHTGAAQHDNVRAVPIPQLLADLDEAVSLLFIPSGLKKHGFYQSGSYAYDHVMISVISRKS